MDNPMSFVGAALFGLGVLELLLGPVVVKLARLPPETIRIFLVGAATTMPLGLLVYLAAGGHLTFW